MERSESLLRFSAGSHLIKYVSTHTSSILKSSKGRDKILGFIQYFLEIYKDCMLDNLTSKRIREWPESLLNSKIVSGSLKTGRKLFRLFRWVDETTRIFNHLEKPMSQLRAVKIMKHVTSAFYYLLDNLVWLVKIGVVSAVGYENLKWENAKNYVSIAKYAVVMILTFLSTLRIYNKEKFLRREFLKFSGRAPENIIKLLKYRSKRRFQTIEIIRVVLRLVIVYSNLKFPFSSSLSSIFCSVCGLIAESLSIFKLVTLKEKQKLEAS